MGDAPMINFDDTIGGVPPTEEILDEVSDGESEEEHEKERAVVLEVNLKPQDWQTYTAMGSWLRTHHIKEVLKSPGFVDAEVFDIHTDSVAGPNMTGPAIAVHYGIK